MARLQLSHASPSSNPLDVVQQLVESNDWMYDRRNEEEMAVQVPGRWCDFSLYFAWNDVVSAVHFTCAFDMRVPAERRGRVFELLSLVNEKLWLGHFDVWGEDGPPMFRHAIPLRGTRGPTLEQLEDLVDTAIIECERFYPAFQYVLWGGKTPADAMAAAMVETVGEA